MTAIAKIPGIQTVGDILAELDARPKLGDNSPPPTPFEAAKKSIEDLHEEAKLWLDGAKIENQAQADEVGRIVKGFRDAHKAADDARKVENEPFDTGKAEVQGRYNPLLSMAKSGKEMAGRAIAKFMKEQDDLRQLRAREAQKIADEQAAEARAAIAKANEAGNLSAREDAERLVEEAAETAKLAKALDKERPMVETGGRRMSLRTVFVPEITDRLLAMRWGWVKDAAAFDEVILQLAKEAGHRDIPGIVFREENVAR